ncbi:40S ribosomal protein S11-3-like [Olea europaea var. sylvestris]|uniref:40S ribosomal protein S11-3-like n=1 Tax=Olea europaea var. sylvestris TaxID=158386 RepID=UPI000C1D6A68|nr:40S ribosomal protein S11-3-like [Olea europaea var. sylvestris]
MKCHAIESITIILFSIIAGWSLPHLNIFKAWLPARCRCHQFFSVPSGSYIDKKCPFTGDVSIRGRILAGTCHSAKMMRTIIVRRNYLHWVKKYQRYEKRHSNIPAHISPCFRVREGDHVIIGQCRPLSKTVRFNVLKVIPAGSSGLGKKAFTGM